MDEEDLRLEELEAIGRDWRHEAATTKPERLAIQSQHWSSQDATYEGMLGGFTEIGGADLLFSRKILERTLKSMPSTGSRSVMDVGAGVGRITKELLLNMFDHVSLVEPCVKHLDQARRDLEGQSCDFFPLVFQDFPFELHQNRYDILWVQWVLLYLTDDEAVETLRRAVGSLKPGGYIIVKDNVVDGDEALPDLEDRSITRPIALFELLFERAGIPVVFSAPQTGFPDYLLDVHCWVLHPNSS